MAVTANLEIISREMIKPSSPTPHHLRSLKLSFLDQIAPNIYIPLIFSYQAKQLHTYKDQAQISRLLKQSLSDVLTQYYPLAGRISGENFSVDCNDAGALYVEAQAHSNLLQVIEKHSTEEMKQYLPNEPNGRGYSMGELNSILLAVQINFFDCGGLAIGVILSHKIADGTSLVNFVDAWAAKCRGAAEIPQPIFDLASLFPPIDMSSFSFIPTVGIAKEKTATKRFVFDKEKLEKLKQAAASAPGSQVKDPTRVEAVSAFFWRHFIEASKTKKGVAGAHAVSLRPRMNPILPDHAFGNLWRLILASPMTVGKKEYHNLVGELRNAIRSVDSNYVKNIQNGDEYLHSLKKPVELVTKGEIELCVITSWCRFPVYDVDYSWGKPTRVCTSTMPLENGVILMSTSCGEGIEAWVNLPEEDVPMFQSEYMPS